MRSSAALAILVTLVLVAPQPVSAEVRLRTRTIAPEAGTQAVPADVRTAVVAAGGRVTAAWTAALEAAGVRILGYLPDRAFLVRLPPGAGLARAAAVAGTAFVAPLLPGDKVAPEMAAALDGRGAAGLPVHVFVAPDVASAAVAETARALGLEVLGASDGGPYNDVSVLLPQGRLDLAESLSRLDEVVWIEPRARRVLLNDSSMWVNQSGFDGTLATPIFAHGIRGEGQTVAVLDTGLDYDMCYFRDPQGPPPLNVAGGTAFDPTRRKVVAYDFLYAGDDPADPADFDNHGHGTHVAGSVAGDDLGRPLVHDTGDGMAPAAKLVIQDGGFTTGDNCADLPGLGCPVIDLTPIFDQAYVQGARIHSNSWGDRENFDPQNTYTAACVDTDEFMWTHPDFLLVYAAGNGGPGDDTVGSPSVAKNTLAVGATNRGGGAQTLAGFSSRGFAADGRLKPTVTAPGVGIVSAANDDDVTTNNCGQAGSSGTSMACPTAAGLAALARQYFMDGFYPSGAPVPADGFVPSAALVKAALVNSGQSMTGEEPIPSKAQGFGRITLADTLLFAGARRRLFVTDDRTGFATGEMTARTYDIDVIGTGSPLKVTLVWTDPPSTPAAATNLVNDLDLVVTGPSGTFLGNVFAGGLSTPGGVADALNVEEEVLIASALPGRYQIRVEPRAVPVGPQPFALVTTAELGTPTLQLALEATTIASDASGNGWADANERARIAITLRNASAIDATAVTGQLAAVSPDAVVTDADAAFPDLPPGGVATSLADHFEVLVSPSVACGARVPMRLVVVASGQPFDLRFDLVVGGYATILGDGFDATPAGALPVPWTLTTDRPGNGNAYADATVEPVGSPGPLSPPNAFFIGKDGGDMNRTLTTTARPLDLGAWAGRSPVLSFRWWSFEPEGADRLAVSLGDAGPAAFPFEVFRGAAWNSATHGGGLWGSTTVELDSLPGFTVGSGNWVRLETSVNRNEDDNDAFYVDDLAVRAITCDLAVCREAVADASRSTGTLLCSGGSATLDGSLSSGGPGCRTLDLAWYEGTTLLSNSPTLLVTPAADTTYRLEARCIDPVSCLSMATVGVRVGPTATTVVTTNSLLGVRRGALVDLVWSGLGGQYNVAATAVKTAVPALVSAVPLNPALLPAAAYTDAPGPAPTTFYSAFGTDCNGQSVP